LVSAEATIKRKNMEEYVEKLNEQEKQTLEATLNLDWGEDPAIGGKGQCRLCGTEDHQGRVCWKVRSIQFYTGGEVKAIRIKGGGTGGTQNIE